MRTIKKGVIVIHIACLLLLGGCSQMLSQTGENKIKVISDIAYDVTRNEDCLIYIEENNGFEPYLVISSDYGGNTLLLRKYLLDDTMPFNENETHGWSYHDYGGYYEDSSIDHYLNTEFMAVLSQSTRGAIVNSEIVITDKSSLGVSGNATTTISRKIFLLSLRELHDDKFTARIPEGNTLLYFAGAHSRRVADLPNGKKSAYWTRTPETWETYTVVTIGNKALGIGTADIRSGVRPAFCLEKSAPIGQRTDIISGQTVYVLTGF